MRIQACDLERYDGGLSVIGRAARYGNVRFKFDGSIFLRQLCVKWAQPAFEGCGRTKPKAVLRIAGELRLWFNLHGHPCLNGCSRLVAEAMRCRARAGILVKFGVVAETVRQKKSV